MKSISTNNALKPAGHYSQAIVHNDIIYISGQFAINPITGEKEHGTINEQVERVLSNIELILKEAGSCKNKIIKMTIYISDLELWDEVNDTYSKFFKHHKPARVIISSRELHFGFSVEIDAIGYI
ncbi:RidA family protein [Tepidibacter hydrothermalis]|uniref:Rid family detoxifying hydrolase n=1 Tax=Tepidibacter hydrothermalis TaxID=3036126 RepID=A0ABY8EF79_9FIRM|nr:Rid family detoxifying hydrolase [Tepidibacter hydrothermalis]WFD11598.1 Rid family detoxifying hydrolase [Tepidibacter hydrothermalis]